MQIKLSFLLSMGALLGLHGCGDPKGVAMPEESSATDDEATSVGPGGPHEEVDGTDTDDDGVTTVSVFLPPDGGVVTHECDIWGQDCPPAHKCMPWDNMGTGSWNATKCTALHPNPGQPGDACTVEGSGVSGVDDCALGSMCWGVDPETNTGTCVAFCSGTDANPSCSDPMTTCSITNGGALILCLPGCDPLQQSCPDGEACYGVGGTFICAPVAAPPEAGGYGSPCAYLNVCNPGLFCSTAATVPNCQGSSGCCTEFCDLDDPDPSSYCSLGGQGAECIPWFEQGTAPPSYAHVGACVLP